MLVLAFLAAVPFQFHIDAGERPNAAYHLGCLAGHVRCTKSNFEEFWKKTMRWTAADQKQMEAWKAAVHKAGNKAPKPAPSSFAPNYAAYYAEQTAGDQVVVIASETRSVRDFRRQVGKFVDAEAADNLAAA